MAKTINTTKAITSMNFSAEKGHGHLMQLISEYASLRPAFSPTSLIVDLLTSVLPQRITEIQETCQENSGENRQ